MRSVRICLNESIFMLPNAALDYKRDLRAIAYATLQEILVLSHVICLSHKILNQSDKTSRPVHTVKPFQNKNSAPF